MGDRPLEDRVALVAGATRGAGRGIAVELGAAGATVYVSGRSTRTQRSEYDRPETIEVTADLVTRAGGRGIAVPTDHLTSSESVRWWRASTRAGPADVLVNDICGERLAEWYAPVWKHSLEDGLHLLRLAIDTHLITNHLALPLLIRRPGGLLVEVTDGTAEFNATHYRLNVYYDLAKTSVIRIAWGLAHELEPHGATALSLTPGWLRSEMMLDGFGVTEENWRDAIPTHPGFQHSETPHFVGRAVAALAADPDVRRFRGQSLSSIQAARIYGFTDLDGTQPDGWAAIA